MSNPRLWQLVGGAAALGGGYYLYNAGGSPKAAEKRFEADVSKLGRQVGVTSAAKEGEKQAQVTAADAGQYLDQGIKDAKAGISNVDSKLEAYRKDAEKRLESGSKEVREEAHNAINKFDKTVTQAASDAQKKASGWFGSSK